MQRIQQTERRRDVTRDLDGRGRFTSAGFHLSETSSDVSHLPKHISRVEEVGEREGGGSSRLPEGTKVTWMGWRCWSDDVTTRGSDSCGGCAVES